MDLEKYQGLGNDFLVLMDLDGRQPVDEAMARALCDRHLGVGADGIIRVTSGRQGSDLRMDLRNADGRPAEMSGNGIRCVARAAIDAGMVKNHHVVIDTAAGRREVIVNATGTFTVEMGPAVVGEEVELDGVAGAISVDMGNPHVVVRVDDPAGTAAQLHAQRLSTACVAPVNVEVVYGAGDDSLSMRVWERGVGETQACGTGACAAAVAANRWGLVGERVTVHQPGGAAVVEIKPETVLLTGPAEYVCSVRVPWL